MMALSDNTVWAICATVSIVAFIAGLVTLLVLTTTRTPKGGAK